MPQPVIFFTKIGAPEEKAGARLLIESLRAFGGALSDCPFRAFAADPLETSCHRLVGMGGEFTGYGGDLWRRKAVGPIGSRDFRMNQPAVI